MSYRPQDEAQAIKPDVIKAAAVATLGRAVTDALLVSPNGAATDGKSWAGAYTTIQAALDAASTDGNDCTLILISPHATYYDINTTGDPTWSANVILTGTHRTWAKVMNTHASATSIMKLTGKASVINLNFNLGTGGNGLIMTHGGFRAYRCQFVGEDLTSTATALWLDGSPSKYGKVIGCNFLGHTTHMTGIKVDQIARSYFHDLKIHECAAAIQVVGTSADRNDFRMLDLGNNVIALDLDEGDEQHFYDILLHANTTNIDDEVGNHYWRRIHAASKITIEPDDLTGTTVNTHDDPNKWGTDTQLRAALTSTVPFRIVGIVMEPSVSEWFSVRLSADSGASHSDVMLFDATKREGSAFPSGTDFVFNKGTRISASAKSESGADNTKVWLEIQEI